MDGAAEDEYRTPLPLELQLESQVRLRVWRYQKRSKKVQQQDRAAQILRQSVVGLGRTKYVAELAEFSGQNNHAARLRNGAARRQLDHDFRRLL